MLKKILGNVNEDSGVCSRRFWGMFKKIGCFIMQLNENRIKGYILRYNKKSVQKVNQNITYEWACVSIMTLLRNNEPVHKDLAMKF